MTSSAEYRRRAAEFRAKAETETDEVRRESWLETAALWEKMAAYEEENPPQTL